MKGRRLPIVALVAPTRSGAGAAQARWLAAGLCREGYDVRSVPTDPARVGWVEQASFIGPAAHELVYVTNLGKLRHADIVHICASAYWAFVRASLPAVWMARRLNKPVLLHYVSADAADHLAHWGTLVHPWLQKADEIVVPSSYLQAVFAMYGYRARVIRHSIDLSRFLYRPRTPLRPHCLSVRQLEPQYGVEQTVIAYALLKTAFPGATLTVAGTGSQEGELRQLCRALGARDVEFLGRVDPDAMPALYARADIFLNSSYRDDQPLSLLEAMASGLPIVTTGVGDIPNMMAQGAHGSLVVTGDPAAMAKAVTVLLEQPERALLMAQRARQAVDPYSWNSVRAQWAELYGDLQQSDLVRAA